MNGTGKQPPKMKKRYNPIMFVGEAFKNLWRDRAMSVASILVLASCLLILGCFALIVLNINVNMNKLVSLKEITILLDYDMPKERVDEIKAEVEGLDNVTSVEYISKESGLESMKADYPDFAEIFDEMNENDDNPLPDSLKITYEDTSKVTTLDYRIRQIDGVMKVKNRLELATDIENLRQGVSVVFIGFLIVLFIVSVFIIINTIKLAVNSHMEEIRVMKYIGASDWFIVVPYIIEGTIIGVFSGGIAYLCQWYIYYSIEKMVALDMQMIELVPFGELGNILLLAFAGVGVLTGVIGSCISLQKNLQA